MGSLVLSASVVSFSKSDEDAGQVVIENSDGWAVYQNVQDGWPPKHQLSNLYLGPAQASDIFSRS